MRGNAHYRLAIRIAEESNLSVACETLFAPACIPMIRQGFLGTLTSDTPPLHTVEEITNLVSPDVVTSLRKQAEEYLSFVLPWFPLAEGVELLDAHILLLSEDWYDCQAGSVVLSMQTSHGQLDYVRNDLIVSLPSGNLYHQQPKLPIRANQAVTPGSWEDEALTFAEFAAFSVPIIGGPILAGIIRIFHDSVRKPVPRVDSLKNMANALRNDTMTKFQAFLQDQYEEYNHCLANANDDDEHSIGRLDHSVHGCLKPNGAFRQLMAVLVNSRDYESVGFSCWKFGASFELLLLRQGMCLESRSGKLNLFKTDSWAALRLTYHKMLTHLQNLIVNEPVRLKERLDQIGPVVDSRNSPSIIEGPNGRPLSVSGAYLGAYYTDAAEHKNERLGWRQPSKKYSEDAVHRDVAADRAGYIERKTREFLSNYYGIPQNMIDSVKEGNIALLNLWQANLGEDVLSSIKDQDPLADGYPTLAAWPARNGIREMKVRFENSALLPWHKGTDYGEFKSGILAKGATVARMIGGPDKRRLILEVPHQKGTIYALRLRCWTEDTSRSLRVYWSNTTNRVADASEHIVVPKTEHTAEYQKTSYLWATRLITIPIESHSNQGTLIIEGHEGGWAPDILSIEWFELEHFPFLWEQPDNHPERATVAGQPHQLTDSTS